MSDNDVRVEVILPWLLQQFAELAGKTIELRAEFSLRKSSEPRLYEIDIFLVAIVSQLWEWLTG